MQNFFRESKMFGGGSNLTNTNLRSMELYLKYLGKVRVRVREGEGEGEGEGGFPLDLYRG